MTGIISQNVGRDSGLIKATAGASNKPFFFSTRGASGCSGDACAYNFSDNSFVKAPFNREVVDSDNCYDHSSNYRFTPNVAGKYFIWAQTYYYGGTLDRLNEGYMEVRKNNTREFGFYYSGSSQSFGYTTDRTWVGFGEGIVDMNGTSDYLEVYIRADETTYTPWFGGGTSGGYGNVNISHWGGYKLA